MKLSHAARLAALALMCAISAMAQIYPMMGGGQAEGQMIHIDVYYDADAKQMYAQVDDSYGKPQLRALDPGLAFDAQAPYAVLNGKAYNFQYGWNVALLFSLPPGTAIWIENINTSPGLETYSGSGTFASYTPIFGTAGSARLWKWSGAMVHNTYAVQTPLVERYFAEYRLYIGDAATGSRTGFTDIGETSIRLEWTTVPVEDGITFKLGARDQTTDAPLVLVNSNLFTTNTLAVIDLPHTNAGACARLFETAIPMLALPATAANGGPMANHASPGACLGMQLLSLTGPAGGTLGIWEDDQTQPSVIVRVGEPVPTNFLVVSQNKAEAGSDPYGLVQTRHFALDQPGLYCLGFRLLDLSTNGPSGGSIHSPSPTYYTYFQAGLTISLIKAEGNSSTVQFAGTSGQNYYLERSFFPGTAAWQTVAGPLSGSNCLQVLNDPAAPAGGAFYRLSAR